MNLASLDLNLILVFDAVMRERNVTRAGERIGLSQPAVSNALNRLRYHLKDDLFIRSPEGMKATPRALELAEPIRRALHRLEVALDPVDFDPKTSQRTFRIVTSDYASTVLMPVIVRDLWKTAPHINLRLISETATTELLELLDTQEADFALSTAAEMPDRFNQSVLIDDNYVLLMRKGHELAKGKLTLKRFAGVNHLLVSPRGNNVGFVDDALAKKGLTRRVAMSVPRFSQAPGILATTDMVLTVPHRLAERYAPVFNLVERPAPIKGPPSFSRWKLIWHERLASHPANQWFQDMIEGLFLK